MGKEEVLGRGLTQNQWPFLHLPVPCLSQRSLSWGSQPRPTLLLVPTELSNEKITTDKKILIGF
jgi:hypothetical protein